jgi:hypothetical protein
MTGKDIGIRSVLALALLALAAACSSEDDPETNTGNVGAAGLGGSTPPPAAGLGGPVTPPPTSPPPGGPLVPPSTGSTAGGGATTAGGSGGTAGMAGMMGMAATGGMTPPMMGTDAGMMEPVADAGGMMGTGECCDDGDCLCHGPAPTALTARPGPFDTDSYTVSAGCIHFPTDAEPPFAAVAISDGFLGSGGCSSFQTGQWGPLYASHGIVAMIVNTGSSDQPATRGAALGRGIAAFKAENTKMGGQLFGKLSGRYGTSGFSMGGGGTTYAAEDDDTLLTNVAIMAWGPTRGAGVSVPTLVICGSSDGTASCGSHGTPFYNAVPTTVPKMRITVSSGHNGQPSAGGSESGEVGLAFQKVFLEGDERWRPLLIAAPNDNTTIK